MSSVSPVISALLEVPSAPVVPKPPAPSTAAPMVPAATIRPPVPVPAAKPVILDPAQARWATVFSSPHAAGRTQVCKTLLNSPRNFSAAAIVRELPHMPTDAEQAAQKKEGAAESVWGRANAQIEARRGTLSKGQQILADQRGARPPSAEAQQILADQRAHGGGVNGQSTAAERTWEKAYGVAR